MRKEKSIQKHEYENRRKSEGTGCHGNCKECVAIHRAHQEHVPNCMRPLINKKLKLMSELTEHTLANEIFSVGVAGVALRTLSAPADGGHFLNDICDLHQPF